MTPSLPHELLKKYWGFPDFRGVQLPIIQSVLEGRDTLGLMPTGGGKSITFQIAALALPGVTIVVSPLIALMEDQVNHLKAHHITCASINSGLRRDQIITVLENAIFGGIKILYVSPERLASTLFQAKVAHMDVSLITVDEAHCISQWGYDFRPSYLEIAKLRELCPNATMLALTATATPEVVLDIQDKLLFKERNAISMTFARPNLAYKVAQVHDKFTFILEKLKATQGSVIIYTRSRSKTKQWADALVTEGFSATYYHAGLPYADRKARQAIWQQGEVRIMVATNAFGMGIDKDDVTWVFHVDVPDSIESYFQEAGRAGRNGQPATAVLLWGSGEEKRLHAHVTERYPEISVVRQVYVDLCSHMQIEIGCGYGETHQFDIFEFCHLYKYQQKTVEGAIALIQAAGYIKVTNAEDTRPRIKILLSKNELYRISYLPPEVDDLLCQLMRTHAGIFTDYVYIDEEMLHLTKFTQGTQKEGRRIHELLLSLSQQRIISFIPPSPLPLVTFCSSRPDPDELRFPPEIYAIRRAQYEERIKRMIQYASDETHCRTQMLLEYFGEKSKRPCGICDYCEQASPKSFKSPLLEDSILAYIEQNQPCPLPTILRLPYPQKQLSQIIDNLCKSERIEISDGQIRSLKQDE